MFVKIRDNSYINPDMYLRVWIRFDEVCFESQQGIFSIDVGDLGRKQFDEFRQRMIDYLDHKKESDEDVDSGVDTVGGGSD